MNIPTTAIAEKRSKKFQSISRVATSPMNPISEFIEIISSDVATAFFIGNLANNTKAGIMRNPPPAPTSPAITPTKIPSRNRIWY